MSRDTFAFKFNNDPDIVKGDPDHDDRWIDIIDFSHGSTNQTHQADTQGAEPAVALLLPAVQVATATADWDDSFLG